MNLLQKNLVLVLTALSLTTTYGCRLSGGKSGGSGGASGASDTGAVSSTGANPVSSPSPVPSGRSAQKSPDTSRAQTFPKSTAELATFIATCTATVQLDASMSYLQEANILTNWFSICANQMDGFSFPSQYSDIMSFATNCFKAQAAPTDTVLPVENASEALEACTWSKISPSAVTPTKMFTTNIVDPSQLRAISKFRSCCGHDYSEGAYPFADLTIGERDRSMKHYLYPASFFQTTDKLAVHAPCDGKIKSISQSDQTLACFKNAKRGQDIKLSCAERPDVTIRIFHMGNLTVNSGDAMKAGGLLGYADLRSCDGNVQTDISQVDHFPFDVAVEVASGQLKPTIMSSYFDWLSDTAFKEWENKLQNRDEGSISKAARDSDGCVTDNSGNFIGANACVTGVPGYLDDRVLF